MSKEKIPATMVKEKRTCYYGYREKDLLLWLQRKGPATMLKVKRSCYYVKGKKELLLC